MVWILIVKASKSTIEKVLRKGYLSPIVTIRHKPKSVKLVECQFMGVQCV